MTVLITNFFYFLNICLTAVKTKKIFYFITKSNFSILTKDDFLEIYQNILGICYYKEVSYNFHNHFHFWCHLYLSCFSNLGKFWTPPSIELFI